jgi:hypothetical protein
MEQMSDEQINPAVHSAVSRAMQTAYDIGYEAACKYGNAEIERLKAELEKEKDERKVQLGVLKLMDDNKTQLIGELADALERWTHASVTNPKTVKGLIQRAREITQS